MLDTHFSFVKMDRNQNWLTDETLGEGLPLATFTLAPMRGHLERQQQAAFSCLQASLINGISMYQLVICQ